MNFHYGAWNVFHDMARNWLNQLATDMNAATNPFFRNSFSVYLGDQNEADQRDRTQVIIQHHNPDTNISTALSGTLSITEQDDGTYDRTIDFADHNLRIDITDEHQAASYRAVGNMMMAALKRSHANSTPSRPEPYKDITKQAKTRRILGHGEQLVAKALNEKQDAYRFEQLKQTLIEIAGGTADTPGLNHMFDQNARHDPRNSEIHLSSQDRMDHYDKIGKSGRVRRLERQLAALQAGAGKKAPAVKPPTP